MCSDRIIRPPVVVYGIDPGKETGFAVLSVKDRKLLQLETVDFWKAYNLILHGAYAHLPHAIVIEVPTSKAIFHKGAANVKANQRMGVNVGSVIREAELLALGLERVLGDIWPIKRINPMGKRTAAEFKKTFPDWTRRTNQHQRDAAFMTLRYIPNV